MKSLSKAATAITLERVLAEKCRKSYFFFFKEFWNEIVTDVLIPNWHIELLCQELQEVGERVFRKEPAQYDLVINIPPGSSKSTICTIMWPAWCWVNDPATRIISGSYSAELATGQAVKSRDLMKSDKFRRYFPELFEFKADADNKTHYENTKGGSRTCTSVGGTITGKHAHILIIDDPINPKKAASEVERANANTWMDQTLSTRKIDKKVTPTVLVMQRLHEEDPTGMWLKKKNKKLKHVCLPAEVSELVSPPELKERYVDGLLDPYRMDREVLAQMKVDLGSYGYAGQFDQRPSPADGGLIKKAWFQKISYEEFKAQVLSRSHQSDVFADTAYTEDTMNDPSAFMACVYAAKKLYLVSVESVQKELPELNEYVPSFLGRVQFKPKTAIRIEPKASGKSLKQTLKKQGFNAIELPAPELDKIARVINATPLIEAGRCFLVEGPWNDGFLNQCAAFPNGAHDDEVDCLAHAINHYDNPTYKPF